jgi:hypothetical protein
MLASSEQQRLERESAPDSTARPTENVFCVDRKARLARGVFAIGQRST